MANEKIWTGPCRRKGKCKLQRADQCTGRLWLKEVGDFYYDGGAELRIQIVPEQKLAEW